VSVLLSGKLALSFADEALSTMVAIAKAHQESSLRKFKEVIEAHKDGMSLSVIFLFDSYSLQSFSFRA